MAHRRGQLVVEAAVLMPLLLVMFIGLFAVGVYDKMQNDLTRAAGHGADAGATTNAAAHRCDTALAVAAEVYGRPLPDATCRSTSLIEVTTVDHLHVGGLTWTVSVTERADLQ
jgi:Flp pilus assembly protein TadG